jgi:hypothetical protein
MSLWSRIGYLFRGERLTREIDEELQAHIEEAIAQGREPDEARRAFGSAVRIRADSRDVKLAHLARFAPGRCGVWLATAE